jgi:hypothetical protein
MTNRELWRRITLIAHSLACAHQEPSYARPQYFTLLCQALDPDAYSDLKRFLTEELVDVVTKQCGRAPNAEELDLLWEAFGKERVDSKADFRKRSTAYKAFPKLIETLGLPEEVISQALVLHSSPSLIQPRMLQVVTFPWSNGRLGLYKDPLSPIESLLALGAWKLGYTREGAHQWRDWLLNMVHEQVWFRFKCAKPAFFEHEDVEQAVLSRTLVQICVYQPAGSIQLDKWAFSAVNLAIGLEFKGRHDEVQPGRARHGDEGEGTERFPVGPSADEDGKSRAADLVEYAMMRLEKSKYPQKQQARVKVLATMLGPLSGTTSARNRDELSEQLKSFFPSITDSQVETILKHSDLKGKVSAK